MTYPLVWLELGAGLGNLIETIKLDLGGDLNVRSFTHVARPLHYRLHELLRLLLGPEAFRLARNVTTWLCVHTMIRHTRPYLGI
jgi:hypothetical protein